MSLQNPDRIEIRKIVSEFVPMLLAIHPRGRRRYLYQLDQKLKAGTLLSRDEARVRHILHAIESVEAEETQGEQDEPPRISHPWRGRTRQGRRPHPRPAKMAKPLE